MKKFIFRILVVAIVSIATFPAAAQEKTQEAKIYLLKTGANYDTQFPSGLFAVKRQVNRQSPLRSALEILTDGPTAEEEKQNLASSTWGIKLVSVRIKNRTAYTYFTMPEKARFSGDGAPSIFIEAVEKTARQFRGVKRVVVCLDGILDFWSEAAAPPKRCR